MGGCATWDSFEGMARVDFGFFSVVPAASRLSANSHAAEFALSLAHGDVLL